MCIIQEIIITVIQNLTNYLSKIRKRNYFAKSRKPFEVIYSKIKMLLSNMHRFSKIIRTTTIPLARKSYSSTKTQIPLLINIQQQTQLPQLQPKPQPTKKSTPPPESEPHPLYNLPHLGFFILLLGGMYLWYRPKRKSRGIK
jgi:hypothetical protein